VGKVRERIVVNKQISYGERFNVKKLNYVEVIDQYCVEISNRFAA
jgi:hypothetical protein